MRDCYALSFANFRMQPLRGTSAFIAKDKPVAILITYIPETLRRLSSKQPQTLGCRWTRHKRRPISVMMHIK